MIKTVSELMAVLAQYPPDAKIRMASDFEGNNFAHVEMVAYCDKKKDKVVIWPAHEHLMKP